MSRATIYNIAVVLHATMKVIKENGEYISVTQGSAEGSIPTSTYVLQKLQSVEHSKLIDLSNAAEVDAIIDHFKQQPIPPKGDDFLSKVQEILSTGVVSERMIGFIVALPHLYKQRKERIGKLTKIADKYVNSRYMGSLGSREEFFVKLIDVNTITVKGDGGQVNIYRVVDETGNYGFFFTKVGALTDDKGLPIVDMYDCFVMKATPKAHNVGRTGIKETQFSRVRIIENVGKGTPE